MGRKTWQSGLFRYYREFSKSVSQVVDTSELHDGVRRRLTDIYDFYLDEATRESLAKMGRAQRWVRCFGWILYNLFLKLSPIRRALLVVIFVCLFLGGFNYETNHFAIYLESST